MKSSPALIALDILLYFVSVYFASRHKGNTKLYLLLAYTAVLVFCLYAAWGGDYYHLIEDIDNMQNGFEVNMEPVYYSISSFTRSNLQFRFIVWGGALLLFYLSTRNVKYIPRHWMLYMLVLCFLPRISYARVSLAMTMMTYGSVLINKKESRNKFNFIFGTTLIVCSVFFHKTASFGIAMILVSLLLYKKMSKRVLVVTAIAVPVLAIIVAILLGNIVSQYFDSGQMMLYMSQRYLEAEQVEVGSGQFVEELLMRLSFYSIFLLFVLSVLRDHYSAMPKQMKVLSCTMFFTIAIASIFALDLGYSTYVIYNRFLYFAIFPSTFFLAYCYQTKFAMKWTKATMIIGFSAATYALVYAYYNSVT